MNWLGRSYSWWLNLPNWLRFILCWPFILLLTILPLLLTLPDLYFGFISHQSEFVGSLSYLMVVLAFYISSLLLMTKHQIKFCTTVCALCILGTILSGMLNMSEKFVWDNIYFSIWNFFSLLTVRVIYKLPVKSPAGVPLHHRSGGICRLYAIILMATSGITVLVYFAAALRVAYWPIEGYEPQGTQYLVSMLRNMTMGHGFESETGKIEIPMLLESVTFILAYYLFRSVKPSMPDLAST